jgi:outer membrane lipoprotein SlyB
MPGNPAAQACAALFMKDLSMFARSLLAVLSVATLAISSGCVVAPPREVRREVRPAPVAAPVPVYVEFGVVRSIEIIATPARNTAGGAVLGAVIGGVIGHQLGGGSGKALATGAGVIGGAVAGNAIENRNRRDDEVYRVNVRMDNGSAREFDFQRIDDLRVGDRVKFEGGQLHRL